MLGQDKYMEDSKTRVAMMKENVLGTYLYDVIQTDKS